MRGLGLDARGEARARFPVGFRLRLARCGLVIGGSIGVDFAKGEHAMGNRATGGCLCGAVRFEVDGDPLFSSNCHCRECQRASGSGYMPLMGYPTSAVRVTGDVRYFERMADSGTSETEGFCPVCGARLFAHAQ